MKTNRISYRITLAVFFMLMTFINSRGTINSITLNPANPTLLSNTRSYYLAGKAYNFTVRVIDPDITAWSDITEVRLTVPNSTNTVVRIHTITGPATFTTQVVTGTVGATASIAGSLNNFTVTFTITYQWNTEQSNWTANRSVVGSTTTTVPANNTLTDTKLVSYGVRSSTRIVNFAQDGVAADGMINPWHSLFNVTGVITYDVPGATTTDAVHLIADALAAEITSARLILDGAVATPVATDADEMTLSLSVPAEYFAGPPVGPAVIPLGNHNWTVEVLTATAGGPDVSTNQLAINCNRVEITNVVFLNGGGRDNVPEYWRSTTLANTQVRITAQMQSGGGTMVGNTTIRITDNDGTPNNTEVLISNGQNTGTANVTYPTVAVGATDMLAYSVTSVSGGAYDAEQNLAVRIKQDAFAARIVYWENEDPPGDNAATFTGTSAPKQTSYSLTLYWTPLTEGLPDYDGDFYSYRLYYKKTTDLNYLMIDRTTDTTLGTMTTSEATVTGLTPLTNYDYKVSAMDLFGNEVINPNQIIGTISTIATSINTTITDGITEYKDDSFQASKLAQDRPLRKSAISVKLYIVTVGDQSDEVNVIASLVTPVIAGGVPNGASYSFPASLTSPNTYRAYIPDTSPMISIGNDIYFVVETKRSGITAYADHNSETEPPPGDPTDWEYTFRINSQPKFTPWPTRILNNVINARNPRAYPAYFLTDDAYVTIKAYDIKGRSVSTILDSGFRKGGQNIKEGGWNASNASGGKLGPGLYYINIKAKRALDGRTILNEFEKVVVAR
jgi:hypothetical protein